MNKHITDLSAGEVAGIAIGSLGVLGCGMGIVFAYKAIKGSKGKNSNYLLGYIFKH